MARRRGFRWLMAGLLLALVAYLSLWPVGFEAEAWQPPRAPAMEGVLAPNNRLAAIERIAAGERKGPEYIEVGGDGSLYSGYENGDLVRFAADGTQATLIVNTGGRPVGFRRLASGGFLVADARRGLLRVSDAGQITVLADQHGGLRFGLTDDVAVSADQQTAYFTDASHSVPLGETLKDVMAHASHGRLLRIDLASGATTLMLDRLNFANGVVLGPNDDYLLVCETTSYRVRRYWLRGERAGTHDVFADNLPGFPDNITFDGAQRFWIALFNPRNAALDALGPWPFLRKVVQRLPQFMRPQPEPFAQALALDLDGQIVEILQHRAADAYAPLTSVKAHGGWLYFGSLEQHAIGRIRAP